MKIVGIQKLTLLDYPGRVACTVFLNGCNFDCPFCHNSELLTETNALMSTDELLDFLHSRVGILDGVCITGGEPTLHRELLPLITQIKDMGYRVKLDTNGYRPDVLQSLLVQNMVDYVAMDVKNSPSRYDLTAGVEGVDMEKIAKSIALLIDSGVDYELRTTVADPLHDDESIEEMADFLSRFHGNIKRLYLQPFVDRDTVPVAGLAAPTPEALEKWVKILRSCAQTVQLRGV